MLRLNKQMERLSASHPRANMFGSVPLKLDYSATKVLPVSHFVESEDFSAGGYLWKFCCYPRGDTEDDKQGEYVSIYVELVNELTNIDVSAVFQVFVLNKNGSPSSVVGGCFVYTSKDYCWGLPQFIKRSDLESLYVVDGWVTIVCGVVVVRHDRPLTVPPSDIGDHLGHLLAAADGSDVSFVVGGKTFAAHRALLAARPTVFKAELLGSMSEATMSCITVHDIDPAAFQVLLRFIYTDMLPEDRKLGDDDSRSPVEFYQHLLAAADRYAMDRLKMVCVNKLWDNVSAQTVAAVLACAMTHRCEELKTKCIAFFANEEIFKTAVFTDGYVQLVQKFPSIMAELKAKVRGA